MNAPRRRVVALLAPVAVSLTVVACGSSGPQPQTAVRCDPGSIEIDVHNVSDKVARYTVSVSIDRAGLIENEMFSTNDVGPGETYTISELRPDEAQTCTVTGVKVFEQ